jgi:hypothetical protein
MSEHMHTLKIEKEQYTPRVDFMGTLQDIGLGQDDAVRSIAAPMFHEADYGKTCEAIQDNLVDVTDHEHYACIDGRAVTQNVDGTPPEVRYHMVGGTGAFLEMALNGEAPILNQLNDPTIGQEISLIEQTVQEKVGVKRSAHLGGCGGVMGAISDNHAIATKPFILDTVKFLMDQPSVIDRSKATYSDMLAAKIKHNAAITAEYFEAENWDGQTFVKGVQKDNPRGCEELAIEDDRFHGHKEKGIIITSSKKTVQLDDYFIADIESAMQLAHALAEPSHHTNYTQLFMAILAKHIATADRLCYRNMPLYFVAE